MKCFRSSSVTRVSATFCRTLKGAFKALKTVKAPRRGADCSFKIRVRLKTIYCFLLELMDLSRKLTDGYELHLKTHSNFVLNSLTHFS